MQVETVILYILLPTIGTLLAVIGKSILNRVDALEERMLTRVSEDTVRVIVADKLDPMKEDITEIKETLKQILLNLGKH